MSFFSWAKGLVSSGGGAVRKSGEQNGMAGSYPAPPVISINPDKALCLSAFWACVRIISEAVASMPLIFYNVKPDGTRTETTTHILAILMNGKVNRYQNRFEFFETMTMQLCMHGNAYALKQVGTQGQLIGLLPLMSGQVRVSLAKEDGRVIYEYSDENGGTRLFSEDKIWHVKLMGNGIVGLSPISYARNSIAVGLAAENRMGTLFKNGGKPAGLLTVDQLLKQEQRDRIRENFSDMATGSQDSLFVLEAGMKYNQLSMTPKDIELLESRSFQLKDIARFMGVPSVLINDMESTTGWGSGIKHIVEGFYKFGLRPYLERYENSITVNLLTSKERDKIKAEFDFNALLRADMAERYKTYKEAITGGFMKPNEARAEEGWVKAEGGDELYMQAQNVPLKLLAEGKGLKLKDEPKQNQ